ncbi:MAG: hypothetical protein ABL984_05065 [Pyrinomonadaceae bacterium]
MCSRITVILLCIFSAGSVLGQNPSGGSSDLVSHLDTKVWKQFELNNLTVRLPGRFELVQRQCIHYRCDVFKSAETSLVIEKGSVPYPSDRIRKLPDFNEATLKIKDLTAFVFHYSDRGSTSYHATFPSDQFGYPLVNIAFRSNDIGLPDFAKVVLGTITFKTKLNGPQRFYVQKECPVSVQPVMKPIEFEKIKEKLKGTDPDELVKEIESRRLEFDLTTEREAELVKAGADRSVIATIKKLGEQLNEQTKVYDRFTAGFNSRDIEKLKDSLSAGMEFLDRWGCDPLWDQQIRFIRPWIRRLEARIRDPYT